MQWHRAEDNGGGCELSFLGNGMETAEVKSIDAPERLLHDIDGGGRGNIIRPVTAVISFSLGPGMSACETFSGLQ